MIAGVHLRFELNNRESDREAVKRHQRPANSTHVYINLYAKTCHISMEWMGCFFHEDREKEEDDEEKRKNKIQIRMCIM